MQNALASYKNILVILPARLGDTLFYTPAIQLLKKQLPQATINAIVSSALSASVLINNPHLHRVYITPTALELSELATQHDAVINLHNDVQTNNYFYQLKIPAFCAPTPDQNRHQCEESMAFMQSLLQCETTREAHQYTLYPQENDFHTIENYLRSHPGFDPAAPLIGFHLGCHGIAKRRWRIWQSLGHRKVWPLKNFQKLAKQLRKQIPSIQFVLTGSKSELLLGEKFIKKIGNTINLIDKTSVQEFAALMRYLRVFVTPDTGALHVACASIDVPSFQLKMDMQMGVPSHKANTVDIVTLFGPTSLRRTGPYPLQKNHTVIQAENMRDITVTEVCDAVLKSPAMQSALLGNFKN